MTVFVPYTQLHDATRAALAGLATFVYLNNHYYDYSQYFKLRWAEGRTFINVEHDCVPTRAQLGELWDCAGQWCGFNDYIVDESGATERLPIPVLGCVKLSADLIAATRGLWDEPWSYGSCDGRLVSVVGQVANHIQFHNHGGVLHRP